MNIMHLNETHCMARLVKKKSLFDCQSDVAAQPCNLGTTHGIMSSSVAWDIQGDSVSTQDKTNHKGYRKNKAFGAS